MFLESGALYSWTAIPAHRHTQEQAGESRSTDWGVTGAHNTFSLSRTCTKTAITLFFIYLFLTTPGAQPAPNSTFMCPHQERKVLKPAAILKRFWTSPWQLTSLEQSIIKGNLPGVKTRKKAPYRNIFTSSKDPLDL